MAYKFTATGTLEVPTRHVGKVCKILERKSITYQRDGNTVHIKHSEKAVAPGYNRPEEPFEDLAPYIDKPQAVTVFSDLLGEHQVGFVHGTIRTDLVEKVWSSEGEVPTPDQLVDSLRERGIAARVRRSSSSGKSRRSRVYEIEPGSGGPGCRITVKRRFWDSFDLLSVPDVYHPLCRKYHITPAQLRAHLHDAKFGVEVCNPALGSPSSDMLYDNLLEVLEELTEGIRTELG